MYKDPSSSYSFYDPYVNVSRLEMEFEGEELQKELEKLRELKEEYEISMEDY